jgi:hypothetical protein
MEIATMFKIGDAVSTMQYNKYNGRTHKVNDAIVVRTTAHYVFVRNPVSNAISKYHSDGKCIGYEDHGYFIQHGNTGIF